VKSKNTRARFWQKGGPMLFPTTTLKHSQPSESTLTDCDPTSSAEGFPAQICLSPDGWREWTEPALVYGRKSPALLANYDHTTQSWKTSQTCLVALLATPADGSGAFSETWPRSGMMRSGIAYRLETLARPTSETVSGLLPTPTAHNAKEGAYPAEYTRNTPTLAAVLGGKINPSFSEQLMGFPLNHTALKL
jgi:hypothetical protein